MRVDAYNKVNQLYQATLAKKSTKIGKSDCSDKLEISQIGKDIHVAKQAVQNAPDIRQEKVKAIETALASGTYNVSLNEVADKIIDHSWDNII